MSSASTVITLSSLATVIGKAEEMIHLPNGTSRMALNWKGIDLPRLDSHLRSLNFGRQDHVVFDGPGPAFMGLALVHAVHPAYGSLNDPRLGPVGIQVLTPIGEGSGPVTFQVTEKEDHFLLEFTCSPTFPVEELPMVTPPDLSGKGIIISGRGPNWLTVSLAMAYHAKAKWVACFQPGNGSLVAMTHDPEMALGTLIPLEEAVTA